MADNRKYYYLKLKENFFDSDSIVLLEDMKDGILYSNNQVEVIQNHVAEILIIADMGSLQHLQMRVIFAGAIL